MLYVQCIFVIKITMQMPNIRLVFGGWRCCFDRGNLNGPPKNLSGGTRTLCTW